MWSVEVRNGAGARLIRFSPMVAVTALWLLGTAIAALAQSPQTLLQRAASSLAVPASPVLRMQGTVQIFYPMSNTGTITLIEDGDRFHALLHVGGVDTESATDGRAGFGWRRQHGLVLPLEAGNVQPPARLSILSLRRVLLQGASGTRGVIDCGTCTLPDGRQARWLKVVAHKGIPWDIYCDSDGNLIAWGYHESDDLRRRPTQFVVMPTGWKEQDGVRLPVELKLYEDERHTQTIRWERSEPLPREVLQSKLQPPASPPAPAGLPVTLPVRFSQREIFVEVKLNGREYLMMLDTGAGITVVDQPVAEALRLPPGETFNLLGASGPGAASVTRLASLQMGSVTLRDVQVAVTDLGLIRLIGGSRFGGILGFNALNRFRVTVDYHRRTVTLERPGGELPPGRAITTEFFGATPMLEVEVEDIGKVPMLLDTGAAMSILPAESGQQWQPYRPASLGLTLGVGGAGNVPRAARAGFVRLAGETIRGVTLMFSSPAPKGAPVQILSEAGFGLLGNNLLRHFRLTIDYPMRTVVLQRMPQPAAMDDAATVGIVLDLTAQSAKVAGVTPLSAAWEAGVERGDEVLAVDGRSTRGVPPSEVQKWLAGAEGTFKRILLQRGERRWQVQLQCLPMF